jgi:hypothetical protein
MFVEEPFEPHAFWRVFAQFPSNPTESYQAALGTSDVLPDPPPIARRLPGRSRASRRFVSAPLQPGKPPAPVFRRTLTDPPVFHYSTEYAKTEALPLELLTHRLLPGASPLF